MTMSNRLTSLTEEAIRHHMAAVNGARPNDEASLDEILRDYTDSTRFFTPHGELTGLSQLREFFRNFIDNTPPELRQAFQVDRLDVDEEVAYMLWSARPFVPFGANVFVVRNGKIAVQTFGPHMESSR